MTQAEFWPTPTPSPAQTTATNHWIGVASADHVAIGRAGGFMQVCHGKGGPLRQIGAGDGVVYYSPAQTMGGTDGLQSFTAIGTALDRPPYQHDMGAGFVPFRRDVAWLGAEMKPIRPLLDQLDLTRGQRNWGYVFRFGLVKISATDFEAILAAMTQGAPPNSLTAPYQNPQTPARACRVQLNSSNRANALCCANAASPGSMNA